MTPQICPNSFLVEGLWIDRRIPNFRSLDQTDFFLGNLEKSNFWGEILIIKKIAFEIKISQRT